ncbi:retrovirus-related pol polyprotein from transposon TNT 1-94 [Tanacetum coccineum]
MINDPLYIASSDHPGMVLTNTPFNGSNFHGWSRNVRMALGAKLKLGFIDGSCVKPDVGDTELQRWIRCDYMNINGLPTCDCGKMRECTCDVLEKFMLRDSNSKLIQFLMKLNDEYEFVRSQILAMDPLPTGSNNERKENRGSRVDGKRFCTSCNQEGHTVDQCFKKIGYPDWYKGKKAKKQGRMAANVTAGFDDHFSGDTPFDLNTENEIGMHQ